MHRANPNDDYTLFQSQVENDLRLDVMNKWVEKHIVQTYVRLDNQFNGCEFNMNWDEYIWSSEKK